MRFFGAALKGLTLLAFGSSVLAAPSIERRQDEGDAEAGDMHWVPTWVSMPQLVEPNNLPPAPFVRSSPLQCREGVDATLSRALKKKNMDVSEANCETQPHVDRR